jgi:RNA polymerase sigma-70 factor (ECF subfamily)
LPDLDDRTLVTRLLAGRQEAFEALALRHGQTGFAIAYAMLRSRADAEDVLQEALVKLWFHAERWQPERGSLAAWFRRIVVNLAIDRSRQRIAAATEDLPPDIAAAGTASDHAVESELQREIAIAMSQLPSRQRAALALCYTDEMSCSEGADVLGVSVSAMESLLVRGRRAVRQHLLRVGILPGEAQG